MMTTAVGPNNPDADVIIRIVWNASDATHACMTAMADQCASGGSPERSLVGAVLHLCGDLWQQHTPNRLHRRLDLLDQHSIQQRN
jgi:hypothetical protein